MKNKNFYVNCLPYLLFIILFNMLFIITGRFQGGVQPMDDHEIIAIPYRVAAESLPNAIAGWAHDDLSLRFRPAYSLFRVVSCWLYNGNIALAACCTILLGNLFGLALIRLFSAWRYPVWLAFFLAFMSIFGPQIECWFLTGCQENVGLILLVTSLWSIFVAVRREKWYWEAVLWLNLLLLSLYKESFILTIPALLWFRLILEKEKTPEMSMVQLVRKFWLQLFLPLAIMGIEIFIIMSFLSPSKVAAAGKGSKLFFVTINIIYSLAVGYGEVLIGALALLWAGKTCRPAVFRVIVLLALGAGAQILAYPFMCQRYMLPCVFFYALGICELMRMAWLEWTQHKIVPVSKGNIKFYAYVILSGTVALFVFRNLPIVKGKNITDFLPIDTSGLVIGGILLGAGLLYVVTWHPRRWVVLLLLCAYLALRSNYLVAWRELDNQMESSRRFGNVIEQIEKTPHGSLLLVSDKDDGITWESQLLIYSLFHYSQRSNVTWVFPEMSEEVFRQMKKTWGCFHQGEPLWSNIKIAWPTEKTFDVAVIIDRNGKQFFAKTLDKYQMEKLPGVMLPDYYAIGVLPAKKLIKE